MVNVHDEETIAAESMMDRFVDAWNRADGDAYGKNYWMDAELVGPTGMIWSGRTAIAGMHVDLWAGPFRGSHIDAELRRVRKVGTNCLLVDLDLSLQGAQQAPPGAVVDAHGVIRTRLKHVLEKRGEEWQIVAAQNTFVTLP
jgi:uncharacterized protein (TIGR02246 family)